MQGRASSAAEQVPREGASAGSAGMGDEAADTDIFLVGDIHGDLAGLNRALWARGLLRGRHWRKGAHLICVGDYTDRNPGGVAVLRLLRGLEEKGHATCLLGNHDVAMIATALVVRRNGR